MREQALLGYFNAYSSIRSGINLLINNILLGGMQRLSPCWPDSMTSRGTHPVIDAYFLNTNDSHASPGNIFFACISLKV